MDRLKRSGKRVLGATRKRSDSLFLDLAGDPEAWRFPEDVGVAILCAGVTKMEDCRKDPAGSARVNVQGVSAAANRLAALGAFVIYPSTNVVFDGSAPRRLADAPPCPTTEYGRQKAAAEKLLLRLGDQVSVARFTKLVSARVPFFRRWVEALKEGRAIHPFSDMVMAPSPLSFCLDVLERLAETRLPGVIQVSPDQDITYAEAALRIARRLGADESLVQPVRSAESGVVLDSLPAHTTLDTTRFAAELGMKQPSVWEAMDSVA